MRRRLGSLAVAGLFLLAFAAPVAARERVRESGTFYSFFSFSSSCSGNTCTDTSVDAFSGDAATLVVCFNEFTFNSRTGRFIAQQNGCTETDPAALAISSSFVVTLAPTPVTLFNCNQRRCTEGATVTVSAADRPAEPIQTVTGRVTIKDGTCTTRISFTDRSAAVVGTLTVDGIDLDEKGFATISDQTVTTSCR